MYDYIIYQGRNGIDLLSNQYLFKNQHPNSDVFQYGQNIKQ